jgi:hypothetical protein
MSDSILQRSGASPRQVREFPARVSLFSVMIMGAFHWKDGEVYEDWRIGKSSNPLLIPQTLLYLKF